MAVLVKGKLDNEPEHNCLNELPPGNAFLGNRIYQQYKLPVGSIARCSCGILWVAKEYGYTYSQWEKAGKWLNFKHRRDGWRGVKNESY